MGLFALTALSVFWTYGYFWNGGNPFTDAALAWRCAQFAGGVMGILLAHEMAHYIVARRHGFALSLPYFIPFPFMFGTLGAIIRLRSLPRDRSGLLEMGAAGPLAGFSVAILVLVLGLPGTVEQEAVQIVMEWPPPPLPDPALPSGLDRFLLRWMPEADGSSIPLLIMSNPPVMDLIGLGLLGAVPGRYAELSPLALAGWLGCLLTAINLVPIGQLDGGHIANALSPRHALRVSNGLLLILLPLGLVWPGWAFWALLLYALRARHSLPVPQHPPPSKRALWVAVAAAVAFLGCFMLKPAEQELVALTEVTAVTPDGRAILRGELEAQASRLEAHAEAIRALVETDASR